MIIRPTTLILGAGASVPYNFPTGADLTARVIQSASNALTQHGNKHLFQRFSDSEIHEFKEALSKSGKTSVDAFLEHRTEFIPLGKWMIALELIKCEHEPYLHPYSKGWYQYLYSYLNARFDSFKENKLRILTFNYDRSLESYLITVLHHSYGKQIKECAEQLKAIPIVHLHGDLGPLPTLNGGKGRPYENLLTETTLEIASLGIKIIHENSDEDAAFIKAKAILESSKVICFLGFGFNETNIRRLGFGSATAYPEAFINGSMMGLTAAERGYVSSLFKGRFQIHTQEQRVNCDALDFLRNSGNLHPN